MALLLSNEIQMTKEIVKMKNKGKCRAKENLRLMIGETNVETILSEEEFNYELINEDVVEISKRDHKIGIFSDLFYENFSIINQELSCYEIRVFNNITKQVAYKQLTREEAKALHENIEFEYMF